MVTHQTPGPNRPLEALRNPAQVVDKALTISIAEENILTRVPTRHHMVKSTFKLYSKWTGHKPILAGQLVPMHDTRPDPKVLYLPSGARHYAILMVDPFSVSPFSL